MNKRMNLCASLIAMALASGVTTSCSIDDTYDLDKEFDMTVGLGAEGLSLRLGNTEHVMLNDVLDIEDNDLVETDGQNLYYLVKTDHTSFDVSVKNAIGSIKHVEINSSQDVVSFEDFDNPDGASSVIVAAGREFSKTDVDGSSPLEANIDDISDDINSLRAIYPKSSVFDLKLEVSPSNPNLDFVIESVRNMEIQFPDYVKILNADADNVLHIANQSGVGAKSVVLGQVYLDHLDFGEGSDGLGLPIETDEQGNHYIYFTDDITMRGDFAVTSTREQSMYDGDVVKMRLFVELQGGGQIEAERVQGEVNPEINPEIDPVEISNDLPDFLTDNRVTLNMQNPTIRFDIDATNLPVPVEFSGSVTSVAITRIRPRGKARAAGLSAGSMPTIGTLGWVARRAAAATEVAVLHAMTIALAPSARKRSTMARERSSTCASSAENLQSSRSIYRMFSAVESSFCGLWMKREASE